MIKLLKEITPYLDFIERISKSPTYCDPMLLSDEQIRLNLMDSVDDETNVILGVFDNEQIIGFFVFYICIDEMYGEKLVGLSDDKIAYQEVINYLKENYRGFSIDFVTNARNELMKDILRENNADFDLEQQRMILENFNKVNYKHNIIELNDSHENEYLMVHQDENVYWTGEKVLKARDMFKIIVCVVDGKIVGYVDITYSHEENEPYNVYVMPEYRNQGIASEMLSFAIEKNENKNVMLLVEINNEAALRVFNKLGFTNSGPNSITITLKI